MGVSHSAEAFAYQSHVVPGPASGETPVHRSLLSPDRLIHSMNDVRTLYDNFARGVRLSRDFPCLGTRKVLPDGSRGEYEWMTYGEVDARATHAGSGLVHRGLRPSSFVGIYALNRAEWIVCEQACNRHTLTTVPMYDTLGPDVASYIVNETEMTTVCCSADKVDTLVRMGPRCPSLSLVVQFEPVDEAVRARARDAGLHLLSLAELEDEGRQHPHPHAIPQPDDLATICYTSGTTGDPKARRRLAPAAPSPHTHSFRLLTPLAPGQGAMLTHRNFAAVVAATNMAGIAIEPEDTHVSCACARGRPAGKAPFPALTHAQTCRWPTCSSAPCPRRASTTAPAWASSKAT